MIDVMRGNFERSEVPTWVLNALIVIGRVQVECELLLIANCEFLYKTQSIDSQEIEYAMNNVIRDHTPFVRMLACDP